MSNFSPGPLGQFIPVTKVAPFEAISHEIKKADLA